MLLALMVIVKEWKKPVESFGIRPAFLLNSGGALPGR